MIKDKNTRLFQEGITRKMIKGYISVIMKMKFSTD